MSKIAFVFPGQGSQSVGMGKELFEHFSEAREVFGAADDALAAADDGRPGSGKLSALCFEGPEEALRLTANAQPAILTVSLAAHAVARKRLPKPDYVAGHSLGEFSALAASEAFPLRDAVKAVRTRGLLMQDAVPVGQGAMSAILGLDSEQVAQACRETEAELASLGRATEKVQPANLNEPSQTVISGHAEAVAKAGARALALGAKKVIPLPVSAPFHSALMAPVEKPLRELLETMAFKAPSAPGGHQRRGFSQRRPGPHRPLAGGPGDRAGALGREHSSAALAGGRSLRRDRSGTRAIGPDQADRSHDPGFSCRRPRLTGENRGRTTGMSDSQ